MQSAMRGSDAHRRAICLLTDHPRFADMASNPKTRMTGQEHPHPEARRSASADSSLRAEIRRVAEMTVEERIRAALSLGKGFRGLPTPTKGK